MARRVEQMQRDALQHDAPQRQQWSALMDGEVDEPCAARLCSAWRDDAAARRDWHAWHLIGDVLRSEDLAAPAARDERFLAQLRRRLGSEPVVVAPSAVRRSARRSWTTGAAVAAGFVAVVGAVLVLDGGGLPAGSAGLASTAAPPTLVATPGGQLQAPSLPLAAASAAAPVLAAAPTVAVPAAPRTIEADGQLIRDARLDRYLAAHKPFGGSPALAMPTGFVRGRSVESGEAGR